MRNAGLEEAQAGIKIAGRNINNLRYADDTILKAESEEELQSLLMKVKEESENTVLKLNIQKTKIMASNFQRKASKPHSSLPGIFKGKKSVTRQGAGMGSPWQRVKNWSGEESSACQRQSRARLTPPGAFSRLLCPLFLYHRHWD